MGNIDGLQEGIIMKNAYASQKLQDFDQNIMIQ